MCPKNNLWPKKDLRKKVSTFDMASLEGLQPTSHFKKGGKTIIKLYTIALDICIEIVPMPQHIEASVLFLGLLCSPKIASQKIRCSAPPSDLLITFSNP